jgi:hypothetical protein
VEHQLRCAEVVVLGGGDGRRAHHHRHERIGTEVNGAFSGQWSPMSGFGVATGIACVSHMAITTATSALPAFLAR